MKTKSDEAMRKELADSFFPVALQKLHCDVSCDGKTERKVVPRYKAVVDEERGEILSIVTDGYRLVTNREAFDAGRQAFTAVFSDMGIDVDKDMRVFRVDLSKRRTTSCVVHLCTHRSTSTYGSRSAGSPTFG